MCGINHVIVYAADLHDSPINFPNNLQVMFRKVQNYKTYGQFAKKNFSLIISVVWYLAKKVNEL